MGIREAERLAELIRDNQPCVVLTGAGISTDKVSKYPSVRLASVPPRSYARPEN